MRVEAPGPDAERLAGILEVARKITVRTARGRATFDADEDTQIVLLHLVQVIGEVAAGLSDGFIAQHPQVPWRQIIATRNRVVHGHFEIDPDILWDVAVIDVPQLAGQVLAIQSGLSAGQDPGKIV